MKTTSKDFTQLTVNELMIQHMMRTLDMKALIYTHDQLQGPNHIDTSCSFYSDNMSLAQHSLCGYLNKFINDRGLDQVNKNHIVIAIMFKEGIEITVQSYDD